MNLFARPSNVVLMAIRATSDLCESVTSSCRSQKDSTGSSLLAASADCNAIKMTAPRADNSSNSPRLVNCTFGERAEEEQRLESATYTARVALHPSRAFNRLLPVGNL